MIGRRLSGCLDVWVVRGVSVGSVSVGGVSVESVRVGMCWVRGDQLVARMRQFNLEVNSLLE